MAARLREVLCQVVVTELNFLVLLKLLSQVKKVTRLILDYERSLGADLGFLAVSLQVT